MKTIDRGERFLSPSTRNLGEQVSHAGVMAIVGQGCTVALSLLGVALLARLLSPDDYGLVGMVTVFTGAMVVIGEGGGLSSATIQRHDLTHQQASNLFWLNATIGILFGAIAAASGPLFAWFYGRDELVAVSAAVGLGFIIVGFGVQHTALLRRSLSVWRINVASVVAGAVALAIGVLSASAGAGYWALLLQALANSLLRVVLVFSLCPWRPSLPRRGAGTLPMVKFGGFLSGASLLTYAYRRSDDLLIGWYWGTASLGVYSRAYSLLLQPLQQIAWPMSQVAIPALSRVQDDPERFRRAYCRGLRLVASVALPASVMLVVCARPFVLVVLGPNWTDVVDIYRALGPAAVLSSVTSAASGWAYNSLGRGREALRWTAIAVPVTISAFAIALPWGAIGVAMALSACQVALAIPQVLVALRGTSITIVDLGRAVMGPVFASCIAAVASTAMLTVVAGHALPTWQLLSGVAVFVFVFVASLALRVEGRDDLGMVIAAARRLVFRQRVG